MAKNFNSGHHIIAESAVFWNAAEFVAELAIFWGAAEFVAELKAQNSAAAEFAAEFEDLDLATLAVSVQDGCVSCVRFKVENLK